MTGNRLRNQSMDFAVSILKLSGRLGGQQGSAVFSQLEQIGTSIGAFVRGAQDSRRGREERIALLQDALKATDETGYWLELLHRADFLSPQEYQMLDSDRAGLQVMLMSAISSLKAEEE